MNDGPTPSVAAEPESGSQSRSIAAVERAVDVLLLFARTSGPDLGITEISRELGLSKAAAHRILTSLRSRDLIVIDPSTRRYSLGPASVALGRAYLAKIDLRSMAASDLAWLSSTTNETATLSIRNGDFRMYVDQVIPAREVRMEVTLGLSYPLHAGSSSKTFLAYFTDDELEQYLQRNALQPVTEHTITDPKKLKAELARIRSRGYATSFGERQSGAGSVAAPVFDHTDRVAAVISVSGPAERFRHELEACTTALLEAAERLSRQLGHTG